MKREYGDPLYIGRGVEDLNAGSWLSGGVCISKNIYGRLVLTVGRASKVTVNARKIKKQFIVKDSRKRGIIREHK